MPKAATAISNSATAASANVEQFDKIKVLAADFERRDLKAKDALYAALEALFAFVINLETEAERQQFVEAQGGKWGKVARDNPFQPFVKLAFNGESVSDASRSQYAKVLRYAEFKRDKSKPLASWLKDSGGVDGLYSEASSFFPTQTRYVDQQRLANALSEVRQRSQSGAFKLDKTTSLGADVDRGYVVAILHVDQDGNAHVVDYTERDQGKIEALMETIARAEAKEPTREAKPFYPLFRAVRLLKTIAVPGKNDDDRLIAISTEIGLDGKAHSAVRALSTRYEGALGEVALAEPVAWVPADRAIVFTQSNAEHFCHGFELDGHWLCDASAQPLKLTHGGMETPSVTLRDDVPAQTYYRIRQDFRQTAPILLLHDGAAGFLKERSKKRSTSKAYQGALRLSWDEGQLVYCPTLGVRHPLFTLPVDPSFGDDRMFDSDMLASLCTAACDLKSNLKGWLVSTPEEDNCAILIDQEVGEDRATMVMPLVTTIQRHTTQTNIAGY